MLDKTVEIVGDGSVEEIVIDGVDAPALLMQTDYAVVCGLKLCGEAAKSNAIYYTVDIPQGRLVLEQCDITCAHKVTSNCIRVQGKAAIPSINHCMIHHGGGGGVLFSDNSHGTMEACDIAVHNSEGIVIQETSNPTIRNCEIHSAQSSGITVWKNGEGMLDTCHIFANASSGVHIRTGGNPIIRNCTINRNGFHGISVSSGGRGVIEECDLRYNKRGAWDIEKSCEVRRQGNTRAIAYKSIKLFGASGWGETSLIHLHTRLNDAAAPTGIGCSSVPDARAHPQHQ